MTRHSLAFRQLAVLTAVHFMVDMLSGTLPGFLPVLLEKYTLSIGMGTVLLTLCAFSSNTIQLWAGTLRKSATRPLLPQIGLLLQPNETLAYAGEPRACSAAGRERPRDIR